MTTVAQTLTSWAHSLRSQDVPAQVREAVGRHLLDGVGTAIAAASTRTANYAVHVASSLGGPEEASILGTRTMVSAPAAALANGTLVHALDYDDTHAVALVHPTSVVLPAAFAVGQERARSGAEVLLAAVAGYETACRVGAASPHGFHTRGLHATQVSGVFSACLVASLLMGSDVETTTEALGIAGSSAGGLLEFLNTGSSTKRLHPGLASMNGVLAARLAAAGATGPDSVFEGDRGLYAALSGRPAFPQTVVSSLGEWWETSLIGLKPYPACQLMHATLDAIAAVLPQITDPQEVVEVLALVHPDSAAVVSEPAASKSSPRTSYDAQFSLPWSVAAMVHDGRVSVATYSPPSLDRIAVRELASRVRSVPSEAGGSAASAPGRVEVVLADGRRLRGDVANSRGTTGSPMSTADVVAKFVENCNGSGLAIELADLVVALDEQPSLEPLADLVGRVVLGVG